MRKGDIFFGLCYNVFGLLEFYLATGYMGGCVPGIGSTEIEIKNCEEVETKAENEAFETNSETTVEVPKSVESDGEENCEELSSRITANSLKEFKQLVNNLSQYGSELDQVELNELKLLTEKYGGTLRYDLNPIKGRVIKPHVQIKGLGQKVTHRHICLKAGVK
jgi:hypothetical protein